jgi:hypothetical protein|tara:strand:+ start:34 stop:387 length:354 start_codon:yes stop_codon:yes gene_type:complete
MNDYFKPSSKSKILWVGKRGHRNGIYIRSHISDYDYPGKTVHYIKWCTMDNDNKIFIQHGLYPSVHLRPTYKQIKEIFDLIDSKEVIEYLLDEDENDTKHAPYLIDDIISFKEKRSK